MTLIETIYTKLNQVGLANSAAAFSRDYVKRSANWLAYQNYMHRDFSLQAAIECLAAIRSKMHTSKQLTAQQTRALHSAHALLAKRLKAQGISEVVPVRH